MAATGSGPLAGFEALLAALFPQIDPTGAAAPVIQPGQAGAPVNPDTLLEGAKEPGDGGTDDKTDATAGEPSVGDAAAALAASLIVTQPAAAQAAATAAEDVGYGREKAKGAPALPAILHANAHAGLVEKAELAEETVEDAAPVADTPQPQLTKAAPQGPSTRNIAPQAPAPAPAAAISTAPAPDILPEAVVAAAAEASAETPLTDGAATAATANMVARPELAPAPAPPARAAKSERAKSTTDATAPSDDLKPLEASDKPVHAKPAEGAVKTASAAVEAAETKTDDAKASLDAPEATVQGETRAAPQAATPTASATHAVRAAPETVANMAAQIIKNLEGKTTRFDLELDPHGLGKVDVRLEIGVHGRITAAMTFENPQAAQDVKARAAELQRMLEQAGFDLSGGMTFDVAGDRGQQQGQAWQDQADNNGRAFRGQAFRAALETAGDAADAANLGALRLRRGVTSGVDLKI
jgi:Meckel syndrome type 1 protein